MTADRTFVGGLRPGDVIEYPIRGIEKMVDRVSPYRLFTDVRFTDGSRARFAPLTWVGRMAS